MLQVLSNIAEPLFPVGVIVAILGLVYLVVSIYLTNNASPMTDSFVIGQRNIKRGIVGAAIGAFLIILSYGFGATAPWGFP